MSIVANSISLKKYEAIKIIFIRVDSLTRKTFGLEIILGRGLLSIMGKQKNPVLISSGSTSDNTQQENTKQVKLDTGTKHS